MEKRHLKSQPMASPTCPQLLQNVVTGLVPQQSILSYRSLQCDPEDIPPVVTGNGLTEACHRVGINEAPARSDQSRDTGYCFENRHKGNAKSNPRRLRYVPQRSFPRKWKQQRLVPLPIGKRPPD
ncbi:hypothetical protein EVAR_65524_1 [Eumeta japonica]|uniref:Uncharacterized protein n=1 Tax=Eumeta variegata TaxID=151549 RepID=A0A4C1ZJG7_EUMVA|nr:hypothetical protein EVAR_65524_1 [Eumeta japonica]